VIGYILYAGVGAAVAAYLGSGAYKLWAVLKDAGAAWTDHVEECAQSGGGQSANAQSGGETALSQNAFTRAYYRAYGPRGVVHGVIGLAASAAVTYPALYVLGRIWRFGWKLNGSPLMYSEGLLLWQFFLFFAMIIIWVSIGTVVARRYHANRPRGLKYELARERDAAG